MIAKSHEKRLSTESHPPRNIRHKKTPNVSQRGRGEIVQKMLRQR